MTVLSPDRPVPTSATPTRIALCDDDATVAGEFALRDRLDAALADAAAGVVVDLTGCRHLDAPGLRVLLEARAQASRQGTRLELTGCSTQVLRLLDAVGHPADRWG